MTAAVTYQNILQEAERLQDSLLLTKAKFKQLEAELIKSIEKMPKHQQGDLLEALYVMVDPAWLE